MGVVGAEECAVSNRRPWADGWGTARSNLYKEKHLQGVLRTCNPRPRCTGRLRSVMRRIDAAERLLVRPDSPALTYHHW